MQEIIIKDDFIKLDQLLKYVGAAQTGGESKHLIASEMVKVNGEIVIQRGKKIRPGDTVEIKDHDETYLVK